MACSKAHYRRTPPIRDHLKKAFLSARTVSPRPLGRLGPLGRLCRQSPILPRFKMQYLEQTLLQMCPPSKAGQF
jgi:hypothetical protein